MVVPLGATEQHGPHLPVETDSLIAAGMATRAAELAGVPVVVGPTIPFGYSHYHLHLAGTVSLRRETLAGYCSMSVGASMRMASSGCCFSTRTGAMPPGWNQP